MSEHSWHIFERDGGFYWWNEDTGLPEGPYILRDMCEEKCDLYYFCFRVIACPSK